MKPAYSNLLLKKGAASHGIVSVKVAPREWLSEDPIIDFNTGKVLSPVFLIAGMDWIILEFAPLSYKYDEKFKTNKSRSFYEITLSGTLNDYNADVQQVTENARYNEFVAIVMDQNKRIKLAGTKENGFVFSPSNNLYSAQIEMIMESEAPAPFYEI